MRRVLFGLLALVASAVAVPPLWYAIFPVPLPELPAAGQQVEVAPGVSVNVVERGSGRPVVLVHGHPGSAYAWGPALDAIAARGYRVLAYDRVGYGYSAGRDHSPVTVETNAGELLAFLERLGLEEVILVGWSYGGGTAIAAALRDASRIANLVLVGSVGPGIEKRDGGPGPVLQVLGPALLHWAAKVPPIADSIRLRMSAEAFHPDPVPDAYLAVSSANFARPHTLHTFLSEGSDLGDTARIDPSGLDLPILIVHGADDRLVPLAVAETLHERASRSTLRVVPDAGHVLPFTHPAVLVEAISDFADRDEAGSWHVFGRRVVEKVAAHQTGGAYAVVVSNDPVGAATPAHVHSREDLLLYVVQGRYDIAVGDARFEGSDGSVVVLPRDVPHSLRNVGAQAGSVMATIFPAGLESLLARLEEASEAGSPPAESVRAIAESYGITPSSHPAGPPATSE